MPKLIKNILVPTDFSGHADQALKAAIKMAKKISGRIYLYHRIHLHANWHLFTDEEKACHPQALTREQDMKKQFDKVLDSKLDSGITILPIYSSGDLLEKAEQVVERFDIDMVVMGSEGAGGVKEWLFGSNAQKISNRLDIPVLIIKHEIGDFELKNIVFASEFKEDAKKPFTDLIKLAQSFGSTIHLLYVTSVEEFVVNEEVLGRMKEFEKLCWALPCKIHAEADQSIELGVKFFMTENQADLLCLVHHKKGPFEKLYKGSVSDKLINHLECPILSLSANTVKQPTQ